MKMCIGCMINQDLHCMVDRLSCTGGSKRALPLEPQFYVFAGTVIFLAQLREVVFNWMRKESV